MRKRNPESIEDELARLLPFRNGHFRYESVHHSDKWLDLETLFLDPERVKPLADALADRIAKYDIDAVCGPLVEGAFVAMMVASRLHVPFTYADLLDCGATPVVIATLALLGDATRQFAADNNIPLETLGSFPNQIWRPDECPLCARGVH